LSWLLLLLLLLVDASQQFDVSSLYDDDAEQQHSDLIYLSKPSTAMFVFEIKYSVGIPFFIADMKKRDGTDFPPTALRLQLQK